MIWPNSVFQADYGEIELKKQLDVISVTSSLLRYQTNITRFFHFGPLSFFPFWAPLIQNFWLHQWLCILLKLSFGTERTAN